MALQKGTPYPLGATKTKNGFNFAIFSRNPLTHFVSAPIENPCDITLTPLNDHLNKTGDIWHFFLETEAEALYYGWRVKGLSTHFIDPYAKLLDSSNIFGKNHWSKFSKGNRLYAIAFGDHPFDWQGIQKPHTSDSKLTLYEMQVRAFTAHSSSSVKFPGTYMGIIEKIPYLMELGITAVELLPIFEWNEEEYMRHDPIYTKKLYNFWGYSPISFFAPMQRFATQADPFYALTELKELIRELHRYNIEVILDIVFNHTAEGNEYGPTYSLKAFSKHDYYLISQEGHYLNYSGCGNTLNCNNPIVQDLIIDALRYWAVEFKIDGFRFDLASILTRDRTGKPLEVAPLLERITQEAALKKCKLIAEPWDAAGLHQVGNFFQNYYLGAHRWKEWNDDFRNCVRRFIKGDSGIAGRFATKLAGSQDVYGQGGSPTNSINYVTSHDGFTLHDLVSYNEKHNELNGEENRDGMNNNDSWNCGIEGDTVDTSILQLRERQMKNYMLAQFVSLGIPMIQMGDEYGHTKQGNNNTWCHDGDLNYMNWKAIEKESLLVHFTKGVIHLRRSEKLLNRLTFLETKDITWHGLQPSKPDWSETSKFVAYTLHDLKAGSDLYIAFNASHNPVTVSIPNAQEGFEWVWLVNTQAPHPHDCVQAKARIAVHTNTIVMECYSAIILKSLPFFQKKL